MKRIFGSRMFGAMVAGLLIMALFCPMCFYAATSKLPKNEKADPRSFTLNRAHNYTYNPKTEDGANWFRFKATSTGCYQLTFKGDYMICEIYDAEDNRLLKQVNEWVTEKTLYQNLEKNESYYIKIYSYRPDPDLLPDRFKDPAYKSKYYLKLSSPSNIKVNQLLLIGYPVMQVGEKLTFETMLFPPVAYNQSVTWRSSSSRIASVTTKGVVTAKKPGTVTITATAKGGTRVKDQIVVTILSAEEMEEE